jgi:hypothetical protein
MCTNKVNPAQYVHKNMIILMLLSIGVMLLLAEPTWLLLTTTHMCFVHWGTRLNTIKFTGGDPRIGE